METPTDFEWDDAKAASDHGEHHASFEAAVSVFADPNRVVIDTARAGDGENRRKVVGRVGGRVFTVVFVTRGRTCRVISARRSNAKEERARGDG